MEETYARVAALARAEAEAIDRDAASTVTLLTVTLRHC